MESKVDNILNTNTVKVFICGDDEIKSEIVLGNLIIKMPIKYNRVRKWLYKSFFGLDLRKHEEGSPHGR